MKSVAEAETDVVETATAASDGEGGRENLFSHWYCCVETRGLCGTKLLGEKIVDDEPPECVVCRAMEDQSCEVTCQPWLTS